MITNIKSLKIEVTGDKNQFLRFSLQSKEKTSQYNEHDTWYVVSKNEIKFILDSIADNVGYYPYLDDGIHLLKFHSMGIHVIELEGEKFTREYFNFPLCNLYLVLLAMKNYMDSNGQYSMNEFTLSSRMLKEWTNEFRPVIKLNAEEDVKQKLASDLNNPLVEDTTRLFNGLRHLTRIAKNHSNGQVVTVNIAFDSARDYPDNAQDKPSNYYFWIVDHENRRIINGGLIAHKQTSEDGLVSYSYSMHT